MHTTNLQGSQRCEGKKKIFSSKDKKNNAYSHFSYAVISRNLMQTMTTFLGKVEAVKGVVRINQ